MFRQFTMPVHIEVVIILCTAPASSQTVTRPACAAVASHCQRCILGEEGCLAPSRSTYKKRSQGARTSPQHEGCTSDGPGFGRCSPRGVKSSATMTLSSPRTNFGTKPRAVKSGVSTTLSNARTNSGTKPGSFSLAIRIFLPRAVKSGVSTTLSNARTNFGAKPGSFLVSYEVFCPCHK